MHARTVRYRKVSLYIKDYKLGTKSSVLFGPHSILKIKIRFKIKIWISWFFFLFWKIRISYNTGLVVMLSSKWLELRIAADFFRVNLFSSNAYHLHQLCNIHMCMHIPFQLLSFMLCVDICGLSLCQIVVLIDSFTFIHWFNSKKKPAIYSWYIVLSSSYRWRNWVKWGYINSSRSHGVTAAVWT